VAKTRLDALCTQAGKRSDAGNFAERRRRKAATKAAFAATSIRDWCQSRVPLPSSDHRTQGPRRRIFGVKAITSFRLLHSASGKMLRCKPEFSVAVAAVAVAAVAAVAAAAVAAVAAAAVVAVIVTVIGRVAVGAVKGAGA
jgi:hypothetical protein